MTHHHKNNSGNEIREEEVIKAEIPIIEKIVRDETWYEGERQGHSVNAEDPTVSKKVAEILNKYGNKIYDEALEHVKEEHKHHPGK
jgi:hypothetical protein